MITVSIDQIVPTKDRISFGLVIRYGEGGAVRFAQAHLDDDVLDWKTLTALMEWMVRQTNRHLDRERELLEDQEQLELEL